MSAAETDLATLAAVKSWLGFKPGNDDNNDDLARLISGCSLAMQRYMQRTIGPADYSHTQDGNGSSYMVIRNVPITHVSSVIVTGQLVPAANVTFDDTTIFLSGPYVFTRGRGNVSLRYSAGFDDTPLDLAQACVETVSLRWRERDRIGMSSKALGTETTTFSLVDFPAQVKTLMDTYKRQVSV